MTCPYLRSKTATLIKGGICDLPEQSPERVFCQGNKLLCQFPLKLTIVESEPIVEPDPEDLIRHGHQEWLEICDYTDHVNGGRQ